MDFSAMRAHAIYWYLPGVKVPRQVRVTALSRKDSCVFIEGEGWQNFVASHWAWEEDEAFELHRAKLSRAQDIA